MSPETKALLIRRADQQLVDITKLIQTEEEAHSETLENVRLGDESLPSLDNNLRLNKSRKVKAEALKKFAASVGDCQVFSPGAEVDVEVVYPHDNSLNYREQMIILPRELNGLASIPGLPMFVSEASYLNVLNGLPSKSVMQGTDTQGAEIVAVLFDVK